MYIFFKFFYQLGVSGMKLLKFLLVDLYRIGEFRWKVFIVCQEIVINKGVGKSVYLYLLLKMVFKRVNKWNRKEC